jgi:hypothetical protein
MLGGLGADAPRFGLLSMLPGGVVVGFGLDSTLQSAGRGENAGQIAQEAFKGGATGLLFHGAGILGQTAKSGALKALLPKTTIEALENGTASLSTKANAILAAYGRGVEIATVGGGTYVQTKIEGAEHAELEALKMTALDALMKIFHGSKAQMSKASGKIFRAKSGENQIDFTVTPEGKVIEVKNAPAADVVIVDEKSVVYKDEVKYDKDELNGLDRLHRSPHLWSRRWWRRIGMLKARLRARLRRR